MKKILSVLIIAVTLLSLSACMGLEAKKMDITLLTYNIPIFENGIGSKYFGGLKMLGNQAAANYFENTDSAEFKQNLQKISTENHDYVYLIQPYGYDELSEVAKKNPEAHFGVSDVYSQSLPQNVTSITFRYYEATYLAGYVAANSLKENKKIGIITETDQPYVKKYVNAFKAAALTVNNTIEFEEVEIGIDYTDETANQTAATLFEDGCEIIFHDLYKPDGVIFAADARGKLTIGIGIDQNLQSSAAVLTTVTPNYDTVFAEVLGKFLSGAEIGGKTFDFGISDFAIDLSKTTANIDRTVLSDIDKIKSDISNDNFSVPVTDSAVEEIKSASLETEGEEDAEATEDTQKQTEKE